MNITSLKVDPRTSLIGFIKKRGGLNYQREHNKGELRRLTVKEQGWSARGLVNKNGGGFTLDQIREKLVEDFFLPEDATIRDLMDAIEAELYSGQKNFSTAKQDWDSELLFDEIRATERFRAGGDKREGNMSDSKKLVAFEDVEPSEISVDGQDLLIAIYNFIGKYLYMTQNQKRAITVWVVATWLRCELYFAPLLLILSPTKRCGKSLLLDLLRLVVFKGLLTSGHGVTAAVLFRANEKFKVTMLIDEAEKLSFADIDSKSLITLLNAGNRNNGSTVPRCAGEKHDLQFFEAFGFRAVAAIGKSWHTLEDRAIIINMQRKTKAAKVERFAARKVEQEGRELARKIARWVQDNAEAVKEAEETAPRPNDLDDRACDNWAPLFAIATVSGGDTLNKLLKAARDLSSSRGEESQDLLEKLLLDIKDIFDEKKNPPFIPTTELLQKLNGLDESPWGDLQNGRRNGLGDIKLARMLRPLSIRPEVCSLPRQAKVRGYKLEKFQAAFARYLAQTPVPPAQPVHPLPVNENNEINEYEVVSELINP